MIIGVDAQLLRIAIDRDIWQLLGSASMLRSFAQQFSF